MGTFRDPLPCSRRRDLQFGLRAECKTLNSEWSANKKLRISAHNVRFARHSGILFRTEGVHGIDFGGAHCWDVAGNDGRGG